MERAGVDAWIVICRENDNDPLAAHVGGENAGAPAAFLFFRKDGNLSVIRARSGTVLLPAPPCAFSSPGRPFAFDGFFSWKVGGKDSQVTNPPRYGKAHFCASFSCDPLS